MTKLFNLPGCFYGLLSLLLYSLFFNTQITHASSSFFIPANYVPIADKNVSEGSVISYDSNAYILTRVEDDKDMVGVITSTPAISQTIESSIPYYPIVTSGDSIVLVSTKEGIIKKGDFLTGSSIPGVAVKAKTSGYIIGRAQEDYAGKDIGKITMTIDIHFVYIADNNLFNNTVNFVRFRTGVTNEYAATTFRYVLASALISLTLFFVFVLISRTANKGIDALGRNPLASRQIHVGIFLNILISVLIMAIGGVASYFILKM